MRKEFTVAFSVLCVSAFFAFPIAAAAETEVWASISSEGMLNVNIASSTADDTRYTLYLLQDGTELKDIMGESEINGILKLEQFELRPDKEREYAYTGINVDVSDLESEKIYKLVVGGGELDGKTVSLIYTKENGAAIDELKAANVAEIPKLLSDGQGVYWTLDLSKAIYVSDEKTVCENTKKLAAEDSNASPNELFDKACALAEFVKCSADKVFTLISKYDNLFGTEYDNNIKEIRDKIGQAFTDLRSDTAENPIGSMAEFAKIMRRAEALGILNDAQRDTILNVLEGYNDVFELSLEESFKKVDSYAVAKDMVAGNTPYTAVREVQDKFNARVSELLNNIDNGSSGGSGSSGGKGGTMTNIVVTPEIVENVDKTPRFVDIEEAEWAKPYIMYLYDRGIVVGDGDGRVRPNDKIKREEFVKILITAFNPEATDTKDFEFSDVGENEWYAEYIKNAVSCGIVKGIGNMEFGTGRDITRQDCVVMICRTLDNIKQLLSITDREMEFADSENIADYAEEATMQLYRAGIISGYENGEFLPNNPITRAEVSKIIYCVLKNISKL